MIIIAWNHISAIGFDKRLLSKHNNEYFFYFACEFVRIRYRFVCIPWPLSPAKRCNQKYVPHVTTRVRSLFGHKCSIRFHWLQCQYPKTQSTHIDCVNRKGIQSIRQMYTSIEAWFRAALAFDSLGPAPAGAGISFRLTAICGRRSPGVRNEIGSLH